MSVRVPGGYNPASVAITGGTIKLDDGTVNAPAYSFTNSPTSGMFMASGQLCMGLSGTTGYQIISTSSQQLAIATKMAAKRFLNAQGAAVASAANLALGADGNYFQISGTTGISLLDNSSWQGGAMVTLKFNGVVTVSNNVAASGNFKPIILNGAVNLTTAANNTLTLVYDSTDSAWYEVARKV